MAIFDWLFGPKVPQITVQEAQRRLKTERDLIILDVRQPAETQSGIVPGALLIPLTDLGRRLDELPRDKPILTICASSHRSPMAARRLAKAGYTVTDVAGGMGAWTQAGLPIKKGN
ncbi:MAG: rhodanese-like domain-containing protein [Chloroflexi bacterium]|nr:rhodanese-like domain-containing protein [Chloroflexota bacterium]